MLPNPSVLDAPVTALGYALAPTNDWRLASPVASDPLSGGPLVTLEPGDRHLLQVQPGAQQQDRPTEKPADHRRLLPAADVVSRTLPDTKAQRRGPLSGIPIRGVPMPLAGQDLKLGNLPVDRLLYRALYGGLTPSGLPAMAHADTRTPAADERPVTERQSADFPLLGGLDGSTVGHLRRQIADVRSDVAGLPVGGSPVHTRARRAAAATPAPSTPASNASAMPMATATAAPTVAEAPASATPAASQSTLPGFAAEVDDPRLHEEPVDGFISK